MQAHPEHDKSNTAGGGTQLIMVWKANFLTQRLQGGNALSRGNSSASHVALRMTWMLLINCSSIPSRYLRTTLPNILGWKCSVYLFCLAMDPLFTYLNRIPGVISVQGYIDDTTIVGNSQSLSWLEEVAYTYECLKSAGFVVDAHSCFRACITIQNRKRPSTMNSDEIENVWAWLISSEPYPTALAALKAHSKPGYNTVIVRIGSEAAVPGEQNPMAPRACMVCVLTYQQVQDISAGREVHQLGAFCKGEM